MKVVGLTIHGVPHVRYEIARRSRLEAERARQMAPSGGDVCKFTLVDKLGLRPNLEFFWSRELDGHLRSEDVFGHLLRERIPWMKEVFRKSDGTEFVACHFRHSVHFTTFQEYKPRTQAELDASAERRDQNRKKRADEALRLAAPLFHQECNK